MLFTLVVLGVPWYLTCSVMLCTLTFNSVMLRMLLNVSYYLKYLGENGNICLPTSYKTVNNLGMNVRLLFG